MSAPHEPTPPSLGTQPTAPAEGGRPSVPGYEVLGELGRGGMGVVYRARQAALGRVVALKMVLAGGHAGAEELARFVAEAEVVARLRHPNIVAIHEVGKHDGLPFFSLEYVEGGSLAQRLDRAPLSPGQAARLVEVLAGAVHAAHQAGVLHRDLKPANVLLAPSDRPEAVPLGAAPGPVERFEPKVTDFGLAKRLDVEAGRTQSGAVLGTPSYMPPEQAAGRAREIGPAADVYALGATLYECLTGRPPSRAATPLDTLLQVLSEEPVPPSRLQPTVPRDLETVCLKCLAKEPHRRYPSARDLAEDLRRFQEGRPVRARPVGRPERAVKWARRNPALAGLLGVLVVAPPVSLGFGVYASYRAEQAHRDEAAATEDSQREQEKKADLDRTKSELATIATRSRLRPLKARPGPLLAEEVASLDEVAGDRDGGQGVRFVAEGLRDPAATRQLKARAALALHAAVGLDPDGRAEVERLLVERLQEPGLTDEERADVALVAAALGDLTPAAAARAAEALAGALGRAADAATLRELAGGLSAVAGYLAPQDAAPATDALARALDQRTEPEGRPELAEALGAVAARQEPAPAVASLSEAMARANDAETLHALARGLAALADRLGPQEAARAADALTRTMPLRDDPRRWSDTGGRQELAQILTEVAARMEPAPAAAALARAMEQVPDLDPLPVLVHGLAATAGRQEPAAAVSSLTRALGRADRNSVRELARAFSALAGRLGPEDAARAADVLTGALDLTFPSEGQEEVAGALAAVAARMEPRQAVAFLTRAMARLNHPRELTRALAAVAARREPAPAIALLAEAMAETGNPAAEQQLSREVAALADRLGPEEAARTADTLVGNMARTSDPYAVRSSAQALAAVADRLAPQDAGRAAAALTRALDPAAPPPKLLATAGALSAVAARLGPREAARACAPAAEGLTRALARTSDPKARVPLASGLSALAARLGPEEAAPAADALAEALARTNSPDAQPRLAGALTALAARLKPPQAADTLLRAMVRAGYPDTRRELAQALSAVADRMEPEEAARVCTRAAGLIAGVLARTTNPAALAALAPGLAAVAGHLEPRERARVCGPAVETLTRAMERTTELYGEARLAPGLSALVARLEPQEAVDALTRAMDRTTRLGPQHWFAEALAAAAARQEPQQAVATLALAIDRAPPSRLWLARGLSVVTARLRPDEAVRAAASWARRWTGRPTPAPGPPWPGGWRSWPPAWALGTRPGPPTPCSGRWTRRPIPCPCRSWPGPWRRWRPGWGRTRPAVCGAGPASFSAAPRPKPRTPAACVN
jgi:hypothetical protein